MKFIYLLFFLFIINYLHSQNLEGKWSLINDDHTYVSPQCLVIEFKKKELLHFSFDSLFHKTNIKINTNRHYFTERILNHTSKSKYSIRDNIKLTITEKSSSGKLVKNYYARLLPTIVNFPIEKIIIKQYEHFYTTSFKRPDNKIKLKGIICSDFVRQIYGENSCRRYRIEKLDNTYFIVYYSSKDYRQWMVPIKEINQDHLIVYGVSGKNGFIKIKEIKEIQKLNNVFIPN